MLAIGGGLLFAIEKPYERRYRAEYYSFLRPIHLIEDVPFSRASSI
jgi:hypothetical protein